MGELIKHEKELSKMPPGEKKDIAERDLNIRSDNFSNNFLNPSPEDREIYRAEPAKEIQKEDLKDWSVETRAKIQELNERSHSTSKLDLGFEERSVDAKTEFLVVPTKGTLEVETQRGHSVSPLPVNSPSPAEIVDRNHTVASYSKHGGAVAPALQEKVASMDNTALAPSYASLHPKREPDKT